MNFGDERWGGFQRVKWLRENILGWRRKERGKK